MKSPRCAVVLAVLGLCLAGPMCSRPAEIAVSSRPEPQAPQTTPQPTAVAAALPPAPVEASAAEPTYGDGDLTAENPEANPFSETVTLRITVSPPVKAIVMWGAKQLAKLTPGNMEAEVKRPRGSGPVDLEIRADGYLPHHTRLYADREDKVNVRLYRVEDASGLLGFKRSEVGVVKKR